MKLKFTSMAVFSTLTLGAVTNMSIVTTVNGGTVHFKGETASAACAVNTNSPDQTVNLGQVRSERSKVDETKNGPVGFITESNDCDLRVSADTGIIFSGSAVTDKIGALVLQSPAAGLATNIGVQITGHTDRVVPLDGTASSTFTLTDGTNEIPFQAVYYITEQTTADTANTDATFKVQYQ